MDWVRNMERGKSIPGANHDNQSDRSELPDLKPRITVFGVGGAGGNAVNNMIESRLEGVEFVVANTDAQALMQNAAQRRMQMGTALTQGLGAGSQPQIGAAAAEEALPEILDHLAGSHMAFITAGMGGGTGTGAAPVIARAAKEQGILTVGVVTKPFHFEGIRRQQTAERGIEQLAKHVDTLIVIPNQNLFRVANEKTTFAAAFAMADQVLYSGVASITELMTKEGLINLDFADVRAIMSEMGRAMMGTGEASGEKRAIEAAEAAISNPLLDDVSMRGARGLLISITGGPDLTLYEVDEAATRIREEVDPEANIILGATFDESLEGTMRVSVVATGLAAEALQGREARSRRQKQSRQRSPCRLRLSPASSPRPLKKPMRSPRPWRPAPHRPAAAAVRSIRHDQLRCRGRAPTCEPSRPAARDARACATARDAPGAHARHRGIPAAGEAADRGAAEPHRESLPNMPAARSRACSSVWPMSALAARTIRPPRRAARAVDGHRSRDRSRSAPHQRPQAPAAAPQPSGTRISTMISWRFRPSCAARRTD